MSHNKPNDWSNTLSCLLGCAVGFFLFLLLLSLFYVQSGFVYFSSFFVWLKDWQTLTAGLVAFFGAILTVAAIWWQIAQTAADEAAKRRRQHSAARSAMTFHLSELITYSRECATILESVPVAGPNTRIRQGSWTPPSLPLIPEYSIDALARCMETADNPEAESIALFVKNLQIQKSRLKGFMVDMSTTSTTIVMGDNLKSIMADTLELYILSARLLGYARNQTESIDTLIKIDDITTTDFFLNLDKKGTLNLKDYLKTRYS